MMLTVVALVSAACSPADGGEAEPSTTASTPTTASPPATDGPTTTLGDQEVPRHLLPMQSAWGTDFSKAIVDLRELKVGIPASDPRDLIRPIDDPFFEAVAESDWLADNEPGVLLEIGDEARFYPLGILTRHEIVNDTFGDDAVAVTYCPLCNTAVVFDTDRNGQVLRLGVSGLLRNSDLVMWDNLTESLWQQVTGEAIVGELAGERLDVIPAGIVSWDTFRQAHPDGLAMGSDQGFGPMYGRNPYALYSSRERPLGFFDGEIDDRLPALERVVGVTIDDIEKAYPFPELEDLRAINDSIAGRSVVVLWGAPETADALDASNIREARGIGAALAFNPVVNGQTLTFQPAGDLFVDVETGSTWTLLGEAIDGELEGAELELLPHRNEFWFAWQAFFPDGELWSR